MKPNFNTPAPHLHQPYLVTQTSHVTLESENGERGPISIFCLYLLLVPAFRTFNIFMLSFEWTVTLN